MGANRLFMLPLLLLVTVLMDKAQGQGASLLESSERAAAVAIAAVVGVIFVVFDVILVLMVVYLCCCGGSSSRVSRKQRRRQQQDLNRSVEFIDGPVTLQFNKKRRSSLDEDLSSRSSNHEVEHSFTERAETQEKFPISNLPDVTVNKDDSAEEDELKDKVFQEMHLSTPQHQMKKEPRSHPRGERKDSERYLLGSDDKSDDESTGMPSPKLGISPTLREESPSREGEETAHNNSLRVSESPEPHLVSITSKITGPIIPADKPVENDVPREIQSLKFETVADVRKDSTAVEETRFGSSFIEGSGSITGGIHSRTGSGNITGGVHSRSGSELMNASVTSNGFTMDTAFDEGNTSFNTTGGSGIIDSSFNQGPNGYGVENTPTGSGARSSIDHRNTPPPLDHTVSGVSLGFSGIFNTCSNNEQEVEAILKKSRENMHQSPAHSITPNRTVGPPVHLRNKPFDISLPPQWGSSSNLPSDLDLAHLQYHQRSSSLTYNGPSAAAFTPPNYRSNQRILNVKRQNPMGSQSASNTPVHRPKFNN